jgi:hypothetical protein
MADACSFSGPVSRMIYFGSKNRTMSVHWCLYLRMLLAQTIWKI